MMMKFFNLGEDQNGTEKKWVKPEIKFLKAKTLEDRPELLEDPVIPGVLRKLERTGKQNKGIRSCKHTALK